MSMVSLVTMPTTESAVTDCRWALVEEGNSWGACEIAIETSFGVSTGMVAPGAAEAFVFLQFRASVWESCPRKAHETVARA